MRILLVSVLFLTSLDLVGVAALASAGAKPRRYHYQQIINIEDDWFDQTPGLGSIQHGYYWKLHQLTYRALP